VAVSGREIRIVPEGVAATLGSGTDWRRKWVHKGFRTELGLKWSVGLVSSKEIYSGGLWGAPEELPTATAHSEIIDAATNNPVYVEPFVGERMPAFYANASEQGVTLRDTKGIAHPDLGIALRAVTLASSIVLSAGTGGWGLGGWGLLGWEGLEDSWGWGWGPWGLLAWGD
jgi:hypothetical protein